MGGTIYPGLTKGESDALHLLAGALRRNDERQRAMYGIISGSKLSVDDRIRCGALFMARVTAADPRFITDLIDRGVNGGLGGGEAITEEARELSAEMKRLVEAGPATDDDDDEGEISDEQIDELFRAAVAQLTETLQESLKAFGAEITVSSIDMKRTGKKSGDHDAAR